MNLHTMLQMVQAMKSSEPELGPVTPLTPKAAEIAAQHTKQFEVQMARGKELLKEIDAIRNRIEELKTSLFKAVEAEMPELRGKEYQLGDDDTTYRLYNAGPKGPQQPDWAKEMMLRGFDEDVPQ